MSQNFLDGIADNDLIKKVKEDGDNDSYKELCRRYENVFYKICQRYSGALSINGVRPEDIFKEKDFTLFNCIRAFNHSKKTKFSTFLGNYARYLCLNTMNSKKKFIPTPTEDLMNFVEALQTSDELPQKEIDPVKLVKYIENQLNELQDVRIFEIIKMRHLVAGRQTKWKDIAKRMNISPQTAINLYGKGLSQLRTKMKDRDGLDQIN